VQKPLQIFIALDSFNSFDACSERGRLNIEGINPMQVRVGIKELNPDKACYLLPIRLPIHRINQKRRKLGPAERRTAGKVL
jgi:hypothetical protein